MYQLLRPLLLVVPAILSIGTAMAQATFTLSKATYTPGETISSSWTGSDSTTDWVGIYPRGIIPSGNPASTSWKYVTGQSGSVTFVTPTPIGEGEWTAWLLANDGYGVKAGTAGVDFTVKTNAVPIISSFTASANFAGSSPITLSWMLQNPDLITTLTLTADTGTPLDVFGISNHEVTPSKNTTYTLSANSGQVNAITRVMVATTNSASFAVENVTHEADQPVMITWGGVAGNPDSWVGIYTKASTPSTNLSTTWNYLNGTRTTGGNVTEGTMQFTLPAGDYYAALFTDGGYVIEQGPILFSVVQPPQPHVDIKVVSALRNGNDFTIVWESRANHEYDIYVSDTLEGNPLTTWEKIGFSLPSEVGATTRFTEHLPTPVPVSRFYQIYEYEVF